MIDWRRRGGPLARARGSVVLALALAAAGCATFEGPPDVTILGNEQGQLEDPKAPIVLEFSKPPKPETVKAKIARYILNDEGELADEDKDKNTELELLFSHDDKGDTLGTSELAKDGSTLTITLEEPPPTGAPLVLLVEPGLVGKTGEPTAERRRTIFTFKSPLTCDKPAAVVRTGTYFFIAQITEPIATQVKLYGVVQVDPATGALKMHFTKAKRNPDPNRCPTPCMSTEACRLLPTPKCVPPSEPAGSVDEWPDYVPDFDAKTGFGFAVDGCTADQGTTTASFASALVDVKVASPPVTLRNAALTASFTLGADDVLRGSGSLVCDQVLLGIIESGKGQGDLTAVSIPDDKVPPNLPQP